MTLTKLLLVLKGDNLLHGQTSTICILLREMSFKLVTITFAIMPINIVLYRYRRVNDRCHYYEQLHIIEQRHAYLHQMMKNRQENRPVFYLDETWANAHDGKNCAWVERDHVTGGTLGGIQRPLGQGGHLIILEMVVRSARFPIPVSYSDP